MAKQNTTVKVLDGIWRFARPICVWLVSFCVVLGVLYTGYTFVFNNYIAPVDTSGELVENDPSYVQVSIPSGSSVSKIGQILVDAGIIRNKAVFQYTADFLSKSAGIRAGNFMLSPKMTIIDVIDTLSSMSSAMLTRTFTIREGLNLEETAQSLVDQGVLLSADRFLELCRDGGAFVQEYDFLADPCADPDRTYALEGYLFPDTYEIYEGSSEEVIIEKMLDRMDGMLSLARAYLATDDTYTLDEIVTLASMIEKEARTGDFYRVSAVFHNRLDAGMPLQSCVTVQYITGTKNIVLTDAQLSIDSPYNTYLYTGLPAGPVSCPSQAALEAALYPDQEYVSGGYLYFCTKDPTAGELAFAKTLSQHEANVANYRPLWIEYDANRAGQ